MNIPDAKRDLVDKIIQLTKNGILTWIDIVTHAYDRQYLASSNVLTFKGFTISSSTSFGFKVVELAINDTHISVSSVDSCSELLEVIQQQIDERSINTIRNIIDM